MKNTIQQFLHYALPKGRYENKIVLMVKDPYWIFTYWECPGLAQVSEVLSREEHWKNFDLVLRVFRVTGHEWSDSKPYEFFDIQVPETADRWYIQTGKPGARYCIEVGLKNGGGDFYTLARSNMILTPKDEVSDEKETQWTPKEDMKKYSKELAKTAINNPSSLELIDYSEKQIWHEASDSLFNRLKK